MASAVLPWERLCCRSASRALVAGCGEVAGEGGKPWRTLSEVVPGLLLTCDAELRDRARCVARHIVLVISLCAAPEAPPYAVCHVHKHSEDGNTQPVASLEAFVRMLDAHLAQYNNSAAPSCVFVCNIAADDTPSYDVSRHFGVTSALLSLVLSHRESLCGSGDAARRDAAVLPSVGVHCMLGVSRSVAVVMAYIMRTAALSRDAALAFVRSVRPIANPNVGFLQQLALYEQMGNVRIACAFDADLLAHELQRCDDDEDEGEWAALLRGLFDTCIQSSRCASERAFAGRVLQRAFAAAPRRRRVACAALRASITQAVACEAYVDVPHLFDNIAQLLHSIADDAPALLPLLHVTDVDDDGGDSDDGVVWHDALYATLLAQVVQTHVTAGDARGGARACLALLRAACGDAQHTRPLSYTPRSASCIVAAATAAHKDNNNNSHDSNVHHVTATTSSLMRTSFVVLPLVCACAVVDDAALPRQDSKGDGDALYAAVAAAHVRRIVNALQCRDACGGGVDGHADASLLRVPCMHDDVEVVTLARVAARDGAADDVHEALAHVFAAASSSSRLPVAVARAMAHKAVAGVLAYCVLRERVADVLCSRTEHDEGEDEGSNRSTTLTQQRWRQQQWLQLHDLLHHAMHAATTLFAQHNSSATVAPLCVMTRVRRMLHVLRDVGVVSAQCCDALVCDA